MEKQVSNLSGERKNVLIVELSLSGHRGAYLSWIVEEAKKYPVNISLLLPDTDRERALYERLPKIIKSAKVYWTSKTISSSNFVLRQISCWRWMRKETARIRLTEKIDFVFSPGLDSIFYAVAVFGSPFGDSRWFGIVMRPHFHHHECGVITKKIKYIWVRRYLFIRLIENKTLSKCLTIDETLKNYMDSADVGMNPYRKLKYMPDPTLLTYDDEYKGLTIKANNDPFTILLFGGITLRKGVESLVRAVADKGVATNIKILLAGQQSDEVANYLSTDEAVSLRENGRLEEWNRYLTYEEELEAYSQADIVWVGYKDHSQMSGVIVTAGMLGKPVLATKQGLIGMLTEKNTSGLTVDVDEKRAIVESINTLYCNNKLYFELSENARKNYACYTTENAGKILWETVLETQ